MLVLFLLSLIFFNNILHERTILGNVHYINDLTFLSYNVRESLKQDELPLWTPYFYAGHPLLAIPENYMFDLNFLFIYFFDDIYIAMNLALVFYFFISGLGMYLLSYRLVNDEKAAFISAIMYMFNGFMHSFILHGHLTILQGYSLMPFVFLFVYNGLKTKDWIFYSILAGIFFALQIMSGSMIMFFYTALIVFLFMAFNLISKSFPKVLLKTLLVGIIFTIVALALSSMKLLPVLEFTKISSRSVNVSFIEFLGEPIKFGNILWIAVTNVGYSGLSGAIGIIGLILALYSLSGYKKKIVLFSFFLIAFSLLFASGTFLAAIMYKVPGFDKLRHIERSLVLFVFAASILAAYGFTFLSGKLKKYRVYLKHENIFFVVVSILVLLELLFLQVVPSGTRVVEPEEIKLLGHISKDNSKFRTMNMALKDVIGAAGYNYYAQKGISEIKGGGGIWVNEYVGFVSIAQQSLNPKALGILNVKYIINDKKFDASNLTLVDRFNSCEECAIVEAFGPYLYKNEYFLPRYYYVPNSILVLGTKSDARQLIYSFMFRSWEPKNTVVIEGARINDYTLDFLKRFDFIFLLRDSVDQSSIPILREYASAGGTIVPDILNGQMGVGDEDIERLFNRTIGGYTGANIEEYSNNKVVIGLNGTKGWLVASERFANFPGWKASINNKNIGLLKANNAITALYIDGQQGELIFEYKPNSYRKGKLISSASFFAVITYFGYFIFMKKFKAGGKNQA